MNARQSDSSAVLARRSRLSTGKFRALPALVALLAALGCGEDSARRAKAPTRPAHPAHPADPAHQPAAGGNEAVVRALAADLLRGRAVVRRFLLACDRGDFRGALADASSGEHLSAENLPAMWKAEIQRRTGALRSLEFREPVASRVVNSSGAWEIEPGRAAIPVRFQGVNGSVELTVVLVQGAENWRVCELVVSWGTP